METIMVTGGPGFTGRHITKRDRSRPHLPERRYG